MKTMIKLEELAQLLLSIYLFSLLPFAWWVFPVFFFAPDASLIGYLAGPRIGILIYNFTHHKAVALGAYILGGLLAAPILSLIGVLLLGHASLDRVLGFGLQAVNASNHAPLSPGRQSA